MSGQCTFKRHQVAAIVKAAQDANKETIYLCKEVGIFMIVPGVKDSIVYALGMNKNSPNVWDKGNKIFGGGDYVQHLPTRDLASHLDMDDRGNDWRSLTFKVTPTQISVLLNF